MSWVDDMRAMGAALRGDGFPWKPFSSMQLVPELATLDAEGRARWLVARGYKQVSRSYRSVACLPEGLKGREVLTLAREAYEGGKLKDEEYAQISGYSHADAAGTFCRVYAAYLGAPFHVELDSATFSHFRRLGGEAAR